MLLDRLVEAAMHCRGVAEIEHGGNVGLVWGHVSTPPTFIGAESVEYDVMQCDKIN